MGSESDSCVRQSIISYFDRSLEHACSLQLFNNILYYNLKWIIVIEQVPAS